MHGITSLQSWMSQDNVLGPFCHGPVNGENLLDNSQQGIESRLDSVTPLNGRVSVQDLLQDFGIRDERLALTYVLLK